MTRHAVLGALLLAWTAVLNAAPTCVTAGSVSVDCTDALAARMTVVVTVKNDDDVVVDAARPYTFRLPISKQAVLDSIKFDLWTKGKYAPPVPAGALKAGEGTSTD